jgi:hypothetical protein
MRLQGAIDTHGEEATPLHDGVEGELERKGPEAPLEKDALE